MLSYKLLSLFNYVNIFDVTISLIFQLRELKVSPIRLKIWTKLQPCLPWLGEGLRHTWPASWHSPGSWAQPQQESGPWNVKSTNLAIIYRFICSPSIKHLRLVRCSSFFIFVFQKYYHKTVILPTMPGMSAIHSCSLHIISNNLPETHSSIGYKDFVNLGNTRQVVADVSSALCWIPWLLGTLLTKLK